MNQRTIQINVPGKPIALSRPRFRRVGKYVQCYNSQIDEENTFKNNVKAALSEEDSAFLVDLLTSGKQFYVSIGCVFYVPVQKNCSKKVLAQKLNNEIRPAIRPDIDNYLKFVLDAIHNVIYLDDSCVTDILHTSKRYSEDPHTELTIIIDY